MSRPRGRHIPRVAGQHLGTSSRSTNDHFLYCTLPVRQVHDRRGWEESSPLGPPLIAQLRLCPFSAPSLANSPPYAKKVGVIQARAESDTSATMLDRVSGTDEAWALLWNDMGLGAPTLIGLAQLCSRALLTGAPVAKDLRAEAQAILFTAARRGVLEVKPSNTAYESAARLLTVFVEIDDQTRVRFRHPRDVRQNVRFLEGFRQLCAGGLVIHHLCHEFTLTEAGFDLAATICPDGIRGLLDLGELCVVT